MPAPQVYTIGHSNHDPATFVERLKNAEIERLIDVRSAPYSRYLPHFNKATLEAELPHAGLKYHFFGDSLGGRPAEPAYYLPSKPADGRRISPIRLDQGYVDYERLAGSDAFRQGIERVVNGCQHCRLALLCSEEDPLRCHRHWLIAYALEERGIAVEHLRANGETQAAADLIAAAAQAAPPAVQPSLFD